MHVVVLFTHLPCNPIGRLAIKGKIADNQDINKLIITRAFSTDIDECAQGLHQCELNTHCVNMPGDYECSCDAGFASHPTNQRRCNGM